jgi:hypothetical protein
MKTEGKNVVVTRIDADVQVMTGQGKLWGMLVVGGSAATTISLYDNTSATGDPIMNGSAPVNTVSPMVDFIDFGGIPFNTGLYADITTTAGSVFVWTTD